MQREYVIIAVAVLAVIAAIIIVSLIKRRPEYVLMDELEGHEFEYFCADLLKNMGFSEIEVTKGSGDFGVDILAEKDGVSYAFQCKCYDKPIGVRAVE